MSTPTPIEVVRAYLDARVKQPGTEADLDLDCALTAVLEMAERYERLERAHDCIHSNEGWGRYCPGGSTSWALETLRPLAELADRLKTK